jgi:predicted transcriptional regulator of viral defense system
VISPPAGVLLVFFCDVPTVAPQEFALLAELRQMGKRTISLPDDKELVSRHSARPARLLSRMAKKGLLRRIRRGRYFVVGPGGGDLHREADPLTLVDAALAPRRYAVSFLSALERYGLTEHEAFEVTLILDERPNTSAPTELANVPVRVRVERREDRWFGVRSDIEDRFRIADPERAIVDSVDRPDLAGGPENVVRALARGINNGLLRLSRLVRYASRHSVRVSKRIGFLLEALGLAADDELAPLLARARSTRNYDSLFGLEDHGGGKNYGKWRIVSEIPMEMLRSWALYEDVK